MSQGPGNGPRGPKRFYGAWKFIVIRLPHFYTLTTVEHYVRSDILQCYFANTVMQLIYHTYLHVLSLSAEALSLRRPGARAPCAPR